MIPNRIGGEKHKHNELKGPRFPQRVIHGLVNKRNNGDITLNRNGADRLHRIILSVWYSSLASGEALVNYAADNRHSKHRAQPQLSRQTRHGFLKRGEYLARHASPI